VTCDTFVLPFDVWNSTKKSINDHELWQKHFKDPIDAKMWVLDNLNLVFYYVQYAYLDFNFLTRDDTPFMLELKFHGSLT
jgi:hypothetical protein